MLCCAVCTKSPGRYAPSAVCLRRSVLLSCHRASTRPLFSHGTTGPVRRPGRSVTGADPTAVHRPDFASLQTSFCRQIELASVRFGGLACAKSPGQDAPAPDDMDTPTPSGFLTWLGSGDGDVQVTRHHCAKFDTHGVAAWSQ